MFIQNLIYIINLNFLVPNAVRINYHSRTALMLTRTTYAADKNIIQASFINSFLKFLKKFLTTPCSAMPFFLCGADKNVLFVLHSIRLRIKNKKKSIFFFSASSISFSHIVFWINS